MNGFIIVMLTLACGSMLNCPTQFEKQQKDTLVDHWQKYRDIHHSIIVMDNGRPVYAVKMSNVDNVYVDENIHSDTDTYKHRQFHHSIISVGDQIIEVQQPAVEVYKNPGHRWK